MGPSIVIVIKETMSLNPAWNIVTWKAWLLSMLMRKTSFNFEGQVAVVWQIREIGYLFYWMWGWRMTALCLVWEIYPCVISWDVLARSGNRSELQMPILPIFWSICLTILKDNTWTFYVSGTVLDTFPTQLLIDSSLNIFIRQMSCVRFTDD